MAPLATSEVVSGCMKTLPRAMARRWVASLGVTSTMRARPSGSRWVRPRSLMAERLKPGPSGHPEPSLAVGTEEEDVDSRAFVDPVPIGEQHERVPRRQGPEHV